MLKKGCITGGSGFFTVWGDLMCHFAASVSDKLIRSVVSVCTVALVRALLIDTAAARSRMIVSVLAK